MARDAYTGVPDVQAQLDAPNDYQHIDATPNDFGAQLAEGAGAIGQGFSKIAQAQMETQVTGSSNALADSAATAQTTFRSLQGQNAIDAFPQFSQDLQDQQKQLAESLPTLEARNRFLADSHRFVRSALDSAGEHVGQETLKLQDETAQGAIQATKNFAVTNRNQPGALTSSIANISAQTADYMYRVKGVRDPDAIHAAVQQQVGGLVSEAVQTSLYEGETVPEQMQALANAKDMYKQASTSSIPGSPNVPMLAAQDVEKLGQAINYREWTLSQRADREQQKAAAGARVTVSNTMQNATAMLDSGVPLGNHLQLPTDAQINAAYPEQPEVAAEKRDQRDLLAGVDHFMGAVPLATPQQLMKLQEDTRPDPNHPETFAKQEQMARALDHTIAQRAKMMGEDPASYMINNSPDLARAWQTAQTNPQAFDAYAHQMTVAQTTAGVPGTHQSLVPAPAAKAMVQDIEGNPESSPAKMRQMQDRYGPHWPQVWQDLTQRGELSPQYQAVGIIEPGQASLLARALAEPGKTGKDISDLLPKGAGASSPTSAIEKAVRTGAVQQLVRSVMTSGGSAAQAATIESSVRTLAMANMVYKGMDTATAISTATKAFTGNYHFVPDGGARVPADKYDTVMANAHNTLQGLDASHIVLPGNQTTGTIRSAIWGQESGNRSNVGTSVDGAVGPGQMLPATFQQYARPGERIDNPADNRAVSGRMIDHYTQQYQGDPARVAVAYFSGPANVAPPGSAHPWKNDAQDGNGKSVSSYVADIQGRLGAGIFNQLGGPHGQDYINSLRASPNWITSPNADALWLMDHYGRIVRQNDGSPVSVPFAAPPPARRPGAGRPQVAGAPPKSTTPYTPGFGTALEFR
jgi:hypothetical protein